MRPPRQRAKHEACGAMFRNPHPTPSEPHGKCSRVNSPLADRTDSRKTSAVLPTREPGSRSGSSPIATPESPFHLEILQPCEKEELFSDLKCREQIPIQQSKTDTVLVHADPGSAVPVFRIDRSPSVKFVNTRREARPADDLLVA